MVRKTRIALLSTLSDMHTQPIQYDLAALTAIVNRIGPDLLGVELPLQDWEASRLDQAPVEVRRSLLPLAELSQVVIVPVAPDARQFDDFAPRAGWRAGLARWLGKALQWTQRAANNAEAVHGRLFEGACHTLCMFNEISWDAEARQAWEEQNQVMVDNVLRAARRDPGCRILIAVQCQRVHWLQPRLRRLPDFELVDYRDL